VFRLLRPRKRAVAAILRAPLRKVAWTARSLHLTVDAGVEEIALDLDGCHFASARPDAAGTLQFEFPSSPSGADVLELMPRLGRAGAALAQVPLRAQISADGLDAASTTAGYAALPTLRTGTRVPFGADVGAPDVAIVVPVFNAAALVARCLDAVLAHTHGRARLIVIDDASSDADVAPLLARHAHIAGVEVLTNASNRGFTATANRGIAAAAAADIVLLNADAEVGPGWLDGLRRAAASRDDVGTVTAVSDNAGAFSVPELEHANELPAAWTFEQCARALAQNAGLAYPELPTGNGFCLYIRRAVIDTVGMLDESAFPQGYGEENDFCQRAAAADFRHLIAGNVLVRHARSSSFGDARRQTLGTAGMAVLRERWPHYETEVQRTLYSFERKVLDWRVRRIFAAASAANAPRMRLLWVGAELPRCAEGELWNLRVNGERNELVRDGEVIAFNLWKADDAEASYRVLWDWLQVYAIEALLVSRRTQSAAEIMCRMLAIPIFDIEVEAGVITPDSLRAAASAARCFQRGEA